MNSLFVRLIAAGLLTLSCLVQTACNDADAATRSEISQSLLKAADDAFLAGSDQVALEKVVRKLKGMQGGTPEQTSTRDRLLASIQFHIAVIEMGKLEMMDVSIRHDLLRLRSMADAAAHMSAFATAREQLSTTTNVAQLSDRREQIRSQAEQVRQQASQIDSPVIAAVEQLNAASEDVLRLRRQADRLREEASLTTPMKRYPIIEQAIELERESDRIEAEMMRKELALDIIHRPAKDMLEKSQADLEGMLAEIDAAHDSLQETARQTAQSASNARDALRDMDAQLTQLSKDVSEKVTGKLKSDYEKIAGLLQQAQSNARKSGRNGVGRLAKQEQSLLQARIELAQADLGMMHIRGLDEWIRLLDVLASNVDLGNREAWLLEAQKAGNQRNTLAQKVTQDIDAALSSGARSSTSDSTRSHLEASKALISGKEAPAQTNTAEPAAPSAPDSSSVSTDTGNAPSGGYDSPQALVDAMKKVMSSGDLEQMTQFQIDSAYYRDSSTAENAKDSAMFGLKAVEIAQAAQAFGGTLSGPLAMLAQGW